MIGVFESFHSITDCQFHNLVDVVELTCDANGNEGCNLFCGEVNVEVIGWHWHTHAMRNYVQRVGVGELTVTVGQVSEATFRK